MKSLHNYIKYFMSQSGPNDCGPACLAMILNYTGRRSDAVSLINSCSVGDSGMSLLSLRELASDFGLSARCVEMDFGFLRQNRQPCILYIRTISGNHFALCFGVLRTWSGVQYIIADPASGLYAMKENELEEVWLGNAALYFDNIKESAAGQKYHYWFDLMEIKAFRKTLLVTIPFLNVCSVLLGIGISWMLQKGLNNSFLDERNSIITALLVLLFILTVCKGVVVYIRQIVLIILAGKVSKQLHKIFISRMIINSATGTVKPAMVKKGLGDLQKIQNALNLFISVMISDGSMVTLLIAGLWVYEPITAAADTTYLMLLFYLSLRNQPGETARNLHTQELSGICENGLSGDVVVPADLRAVDQRLQQHLSNYNRFHGFTKLSAIKLSRKTMWFEFAGTINVMLIFIFCLYRNRSMKLSYSALMAEVLLSYFITVLVPRICSSFPVISEGSLLVKRYLQG